MHLFKLDFLLGSFHYFLFDTHTHTQHGLSVSALLVVAVHLWYCGGLVRRNLSMQVLRCCIRIFPLLKSFCLHYPWPRFLLSCALTTKIDAICTGRQCWWADPRKADLIIVALPDLCNKSDLPTLWANLGSVQGFSLRESRGGFWVLMYYSLGCKCNLDNHLRKCEIKIQLRSTELN